MIFEDVNHSARGLRKKSRIKHYCLLINTKPTNTGQIDRSQISTQVEPYLNVIISPHNL